MPHGLSEVTIEKICGVFARHPHIERVVLFGSRALGTYKPGSDIDLCLYGEGITPQEHNHIRIEIDDLDLPYVVDVLAENGITHLKLREHIKRVGVQFCPYFKKGNTMAGRTILVDWLEQALERSNGKGRIAELCRKIWELHEDELRNSGDLFYTWQYDVRWAAQKLKESKKMKRNSPRGIWELVHNKKK